MSVETLTHQIPDTEIMPIDERDPALPVELGGLALSHGLSISLDDDLTLLEAQANGVDAHAEDRGRMHDIAAAQEAAQLENEIFDAHSAALIENAIFDAHAEALKENEIFDAHVAALEEDKARTEEFEARQAVALALKSEDEQRQNRQAYLQILQAESDHRKQAEIALREAGYMETLPLDAQIHRDMTGNLTVIDHDTIKVIAPQFGGGTEVTTYAFDKDERVLTISSKDGITTARVGDFAPTKQGQWQQYADVLNLPSSVASVVGFDKAIPLT